MKQKPAASGDSRTGNHGFDEWMMLVLMIVCIGYVVVDVLLLPSAKRAPTPMLVLFGVVGIIAQTLWLDSRYRRGHGAGAALPAKWVVLGLPAALIAVLFILY